MQDFVGENIFFQEKNDCKISDNEILQYEGLLTAAECLKSLKAMESNMTPGTDGIRILRVLE